MAYKKPKFHGRNNSLKPIATRQPSPKASTMNADGSGRKSLLRKYKAQALPIRPVVDPNDIINGAPGLLDIDTGLEFRSGNTFNTTFKEKFKATNVTSI
mmetsp:Transcript_45860/g.60777  ORF Transcript_45860/g.60777 Transcript_45860/m.60777 type:complete len:99 (-) Transcript_45860:2497-2793(-)